MEVTKVSDITAATIADYLRIAEVTTDETDFLTTCLTAAKNYILNYTGIPSDELDEYTDMIHVVYVLCQDMYDNRSAYVESNNVNRVVETTLSMHARNLL